MKYEGDFKDGKADGNGKIIYGDGKYYIGQLKNDHRHGKGILYYKNGNIKYEGDFVENKFEGNGKLILEDGQYYIGQFKNGFKHGKGIEYYSNGSIKYEGEFENDKKVERKNSKRDVHEERFN